MEVEGHSRPLALFVGVALLLCAAPTLLALTASAPAAAAPAVNLPTISSAGAGQAQGAPAPLALLAAEQAELTGPLTTHDAYFGYSVAVSGDTVLVGAYRTDSWEGSAYVFVRTGATWAQQQVLLPADATYWKQFGYSVALEDDTALIGANADDELGNDRGAVYVFQRTGGVWTQQQKLAAPDFATGDQFGTGVAFSGDTALVGAQVHKVGENSGQGAVYAFVRSNGVWTLQQEFSASDGGAADYFGTRVALDGDTALVGEQQQHSGADVIPSAAYVFVRSSGTWTQQAKVTASDGEVRDDYGAALAVSGDTAIIGAPVHDVASVYDQGQAYVYTRSGTVWTERAKLTASDGAGWDDFGADIALQGDTAIIGALGDDVDAVDQGSAYVFVRSGSAWNQQNQLAASDGAWGDQFGTAVAIDGDTVLVGAYQHLVNTVRVGAAYAFAIGDPPVTAASVAPVPNARGWNKGPVTVTLSATDPDSAVAGTEYRLLGAAGWTTYAAPVPVSALGVSAYEYRSVDVDGDLEAPKSLTVRIDTTRPVTRALASATVARYHTATLRLRVNDTVAPKAKVTVKIYRSGVWKKTLPLGLRATNRDLRYSFTCKLPRGTYTWRVFATDLAGNQQRKVGYNRLVVK